MAKLAGSLWVSTTKLHYIDKDGNEWYFTGESLGACAGLPGSPWLDGAYVHYVDSTGVHRRVPGSTISVQPSAVLGSMWVENTGATNYALRAVSGIESAKTVYAFHSDVTHSDVSAVSWHTDTAHSDVSHSNSYGDATESGSHVNIAHTDSSSHGDSAHVNTAHADTAHTDIARGSGPYDGEYTYSAQSIPYGGAYLNSSRTDTYVDTGIWAPGDPGGYGYTDAYYSDYPPGSGYRGEYHWNRHHNHDDGGTSPTHWDHVAIISHNDFWYTDSPHQDVTHVDTAHVNTAHVNTTGHGDVAHSDYTGSGAHTDTHSNSAHGDSSYSDAHGNVAHTDVAHVNQPTSLGT